MASKLNLKHRKKCKSMTLPKLKELITKLEPEVREKSSLLECAKWEHRKRLVQFQREQDKNQEE